MPSATEWLDSVAAAWREERLASRAKIAMERSGRTLVERVALGIALWSIRLLLFRRGPSPVQPPEPLAAVLRFVGRHTLELYAIPLASFEVIVKLMPDLAG